MLRELNPSSAPDGAGLALPVLLEILKRVATPISPFYFSCIMFQNVVNDCIHP
jgi:hypothetical protein